MDAARTRSIAAAGLREAIESAGASAMAAAILDFKVEPFHRRILLHQDAHPKSLTLAPRGTGKSTIGNVARTIHTVAADRDVRILIVSNTSRMAQRFLREITHHLERNERLVAAFGSFRESTLTWTDHEVVVSGRSHPMKEATVQAMGVLGPILGGHYDCIIADDIVDLENSWTAGQRDKVLRWWETVLLPTLEPDGRLIVMGTRYHPDDLYGHLSAGMMGGAATLILRAVEVLEDGTRTSIWPDRFPLEHLDGMRREMGSVIFGLQMQNDVAAMRDGEFFHSDWFDTWGELPEGRKLDYFIGTDPAATRASALRRGTASGDWWAIVVGARERDDHGGHIGPVYLVAAWRGRVTKQEFVERVKHYASGFSPIKVVVEANAAQEYLAQDLERIMAIKRVVRSQDKPARAYRIQPALESGQVLFPPADLDGTWAALRAELLAFPAGEHDDLFDALEAMLSEAMPARGAPGMAFGTTRSARSHRIPSILQR